MIQQVRNRPRKLPRQARSRATFEAIVQAGEQVLCRDGFESLRMNAVAERAGVSAGSLYQYFPNKESIVELIVERKLTKIHRLVVATLAQNWNAPVVHSMNAVLSVAIGHMRSELPSWRELAKADACEWDSPVLRSTLGSFPRLFARCARRRPHGLHLRADRTRDAFYVLTRVVWETCRQTLVLEPDTFDRAHFLEELGLLARTMLLRGTFESQGPKKFSAASAWSAVREASLGFRPVAQMA